MALCRVPVPPGAVTGAQGGFGASAECGPDHRTPWTSTGRAGAAPGRGEGGQGPPQAGGQGPPLQRRHLGPGHLGGSPALRDVSSMPGLHPLVPAAPSPTFLAVSHASKRCRVSPGVAAPR